MKEEIEEFETELENYNSLISEAIGDIITIVSFNDRDTAFELIRKQFVVIDRQDLE
jgi:hypothetical protein